MDQDTQGLFQACKNVSTIENLLIQLHNILRIGDRVYKYLNRCMWSITFLFPVLHPSLFTMWLSVSSPRAGYTSPTFTIIELDHATCFSQWEFYCILFYFISFFLHLPNIYIFYIVVQVQVSPFPLYHSPQPHPSTPPSLNSTCLWLCPCVLYTCSLTTLPLLGGSGSVPRLDLMGYDFFLPVRSYTSAITIDEHTLARSLVQEK